MVQAPFTTLSRFCIDKRDVLVARVIIHAYNDQVRLLSPEPLVIDNHSLIGSKEPTLLCNHVGTRPDGCGLATLQDLVQRNGAARTGNRTKGHGLAGALSYSIESMKKTKAVGRSSVKKAKDVPKGFSEYLATVPIPARKNLIKMHNVIRSTMPRDAIETISYRIPAFKIKSGVLVWFAGFSDHCSLFPTASVIEMFKDELHDFSTSKGTIQFPLDKQLPTALIKEIVKARIAQSRVKGRH